MIRKPRSIDIGMTSKQKITWVSMALALLPLASQAATSASATLTDQYAQQIFQKGRPVGMVMVVINGREALQRFHGQTRPGNHIRPDGNSVVRIASLTKLITSEVLVAQAARHVVRLDDPLQKYAPAGVVLPVGPTGQRMTLRDLATHTSGLPREMPGTKAADTPVFVWPDQRQRWQWIATTHGHYGPSGRAAYSNLAYDFLADALSFSARLPYASLLQQRITAPLGMRDTTLKPTAAQCARLMVSYDTTRCTETTPAGGSGGIYSTANDMQRWLQHQVLPRTAAEQSRVDALRQMVFPRSALRAARGLDVVGTADAVGLGWLYMKPQNGRPAIWQKTAGGGGFISYVATVPQQHIAVFVSMTYTGQTSFRSMSDGVNQLVTALSRLPQGRG